MALTMSWIGPKLNNTLMKNGYIKVARIGVVVKQRQLDKPKIFTFANTRRCIFFVINERIFNSKELPRGTWLKLKKMLKIALLCLVALVAGVHSHGRLMRPASRSSVWRVQEFQSLNPPTNWNDNELFCGGRHQAANPGTDCGVCGDPIGAGVPRPNEMRGSWYRGIITGRYTAGQIIDIDVDMTQYHRGFMEFRLCTSPGNGGGETQACFNQHLLQRADGGGSRTDVTRTGWYAMRYRLPANVRCARCVIQWNYRAGNNWGQCPDGSGALGCGPQETFRGCADVTIN